jgi:hypothetical protein
MKIKVRDGTVKHNKNICKECSFYFGMVDDRGELSMCQYDSPARKLHSPVYKCTGFSQKYAVSLIAMLQIAWVLQTDKGGRKIGFKPYKDLDKEEKRAIHRETRKPDYWEED